LQGKQKQFEKNYQNAILSSKILRNFGFNLDGSDGKPTNNRPNYGTIM
jgi:hypothetical protein